MNIFIKKTITIVSILFIVLTLFVLPVYANDTPISVIETHSILTKSSDGAITQKSFSNANTNSLYSMRRERSIPEYIPNVNAGISTISTSNVSRSSDSRVGYLQIGYDTNNDGILDVTDAHGSASLQSYDIVITAGHCLWNPVYAEHQSEGWNSKIIFYAGRTSGNSFKTAVSYASASIGTDFVNNSYVTYVDGIATPVYDTNHDWGIIKLESNIGGTYGWFGLHGCGTTENGLSIYAYGYPSIVPGYSETYVKYKQWKSIGVFEDIENNVIYHTAYTYNGSSGGPIVADGCVYAIVTHIVNGGDYEYGATRMTDWLFELIVAECEASAERWES